MPASGWIRKWRSGERADDNARNLVHAAAHGETLDRFLDLGLKTLLSAAGADRAGIWLAADRRDAPGRGRVAEAVPGPIPEQWNKLDISTPFLRTALESEDAIRIETGSEGSMPQVGPLVGMRDATWLPLRAGNRTFGLAMVAHAGRGVHLDKDRLCRHADEIALGIAHQVDLQRFETVSDELRSHLRLSRAILCVVSVESIFAQIARAARHYAEMEFVALGTPADAPALAEGWDGSNESRALLHRQAIKDLWSRVMQTGREVELHGDVLGIPSDAGAVRSFAGLDRVIALPVEVRGSTRAVLLAGGRSSTDPAEDSARLESYSLLAAAALDRDMARTERDVSRRVATEMIEHSGEFLVAVDEAGYVSHASRLAREFLAVEQRSSRRLQFVDLFSRDARNAVRKWLDELRRSTVSQAAGGDRGVSSVEASLHSGLAICMDLRLMYESDDDGARTWLVRLEDRDSRRVLLEAEGRLQAEMLGLMDSIDSGVLLLDAAGNIRVASNRLGEIMGVEPGRLVEWKAGGSLDAVIDSVAGRCAHPAETAERWREHALRGEEAEWDELELLRPSHKILERFARPLLSRSGTRLGWLEMYRDVTAQRSIRSKLLQSEKMAALGQLVSGIAHELNNPLTSIQGYAQLLLARGSGADRSADAQRISEEAARAAKIVKNLLLFSRETKSERRPVHLNEVVERTLALRAYELKIDNIAVELNLDAGLPYTLADSAQLQQVVLNLLLNAEQAIQQGRREGGVHGRIRVSTRRLSANRIAMEISDDGPGIEPDLVSRIFDPFFTTKAAGMGTGLGLSIIYGIIQEHGGEVSVAAVAGGGASLTVELPSISMESLGITSDAEGGSKMAGAAGRLAPQPEQRTEAPPQQVLVVEDEPTVAHLIADVLSDEGHRVQILLDSRKALEELKLNRYDLIICDLKMPHLDGPALYRALQRDENDLRHRLLFVTGDTMSPRTLEFLESSVLPYLAKPFLVEELNEAVRLAIFAISSAHGPQAQASAELSRTGGRKK